MVSWPNCDFSVFPSTELYVGFDKGAVKTEAILAGCDR